MRWQLMITICLLLAAPAFEGAVAAERSNDARSSRSHGPDTGRKSAGEATERQRERERGRTASEHRASSADRESEREEYDHDREDD